VEKEFCFLVSLSKNFDFLFWKFSRSSLGYLKAKVNPNVVKNYKIKLKSIVKNSKNVNLFQTLKIINSEINKWINIYSVSDCWKSLSSDLDLYLYKLFWRFVRRCHPRRSNTWIYSKYWKSFSGVWKFVIFDSLNGKFCFLKLHFSYHKIIYSIPSSLITFNLFNKRKFLFILFKKFENNFIGSYHFLYLKQKGLCSFCGRPFSFNNVKIVSKSSFLKKNKISVLDLFLLHSFCNF